ncbi:hypothetical protein ACRAD_29460 (plasmid) [Acinetobacter radioresistens DSM 6976 = NBRC 102413 = CIP 103788]|nr:hypothetical protein ACRAD_29460 [Acinetobacter radioresistens DSM 6976 = NBRC 102413 = CIP 103788]
MPKTAIDTDRVMQNQSAFLLDNNAPNDVTNTLIQMHRAKINTSWSDNEG